MAIPTLNQFNERISFLMSKPDLQGSQSCHACTVWACIQPMSLSHREESLDPFEIDDHATRLDHGYIVWTRTKPDQAVQKIMWRDETLCRVSSIQRICDDVSKIPVWKFMVCAREHIHLVEV